MGMKRTDEFRADAVRIALTSGLTRVMDERTYAGRATVRTCHQRVPKAASGYTRAIKSGAARPDQPAMIAAEAGTSNRTEAELVDVIITRADSYEAAVSHAAGLRVSLDTQLEATEDPHKYETILERGKVQAAVLAKSLGIEVN